MKRIIKRIFIGSGLFFVFLILGFCSEGVLSPIPFRYLDSFKGKVVDAVNKKPIPGAIVLAVYYKESSSVAGSMTRTVDGLEVLTDDKGEFKIPWTLRWFTIYRGFTRGNIIIFKPGYGVFPWHKRSDAVSENDSWPPSGKYIIYELPKLKTREERDKNLPSLHIGDISKKYNSLLRMINEERTYLGYEKLPMD